MFGAMHILPSSAAVEAFNREAVAAAGVLCGTPALTLRRLAEEIFRSAGDERRSISTVGRRLLLESIAGEQYREGRGNFAPVAGFPGFVGSLDSLFAELKQALVEPERFTGLVRRLPGSGRLDELARLYRAYDAALAGKGLLDRYDEELAALSHLKKGGRLPAVFDGVSVVSCRDIYDLSPLQIALLAEISRRIPVELRLPWYPEKSHMFGYVAGTADALEALDNSELQLEPLFVEPEGPFFAPFLTADGDYDAVAGSRAGLQENMSLIAAPGPYRECEEIGRRIRGLLEEGIDPTAVAVVFRDIQEYGPMLEDVCRRYRIPVSYRRGVPLVTSPLVQACLAPFAVVRSRFGREELLTLIKSSYFDSDRLGVPPETIEEVLVAAGYIDETVGSADEALGRRISFLQRLGRSSAREEASRRALRHLLGELRRFQGSRTLREFTAFLETFIERHRIYRLAIGAADQRSLKRDASAIALFRQVLKELERDIRVLGQADTPLTPDDFTTLLRQGMEGAFLAGERGAGVTILNFHDARGLRFDHLFLGGLNEGVCPARHDGHPLLKDGDKLLLQKASGSRHFRTAREKEGEEPLLFGLALGCAVQSLTLSYSYIDSRGGALLRSPFLEEYLERLPVEESRVPVSRITPEPAACLEREEILNTLAYGRHVEAPPGGDPPLSASLARIAANAVMEDNRERFFQSEEKTSRTALATPHTGALQRSDIVAELRAYYESPPGNRFAPTTLEEYGCCPFRYFLKRLVGVAPLDKPEMELPAKDEGSLVHEILQKLFTRLGEEGLLPLSDAGVVQAQELLREEAGRVYARWEGERSTGEPLLWEIGKGEILAVLEHVVGQEADDGSGFVPTLFEHPFAELDVEDDDGTRIGLQGKIDRVDVSPDGRLRVVDYKLGGNASRYRAFLKKEELGETSFQVPVYLLAAARELGAEGGGAITRFAARYWLLRRLDRVERDFTDGKEDFAGFFSADPAERHNLGDDNFLNRLCSTVRAMKGGDFQITPRECETCDFGSVCRYVEVGLREEE
jgi:ATP-dependent helicase/nuclease subunit B